MTQIQNARPSHDTLTTGMTWRKYPQDDGDTTEYTASMVTVQGSAEGDTTRLELGLTVIASHQLLTGDLQGHLYLQVERWEDGDPDIIHTQALPVALDGAQLVALLASSPVASGLSLTSGPVAQPQPVPRPEHPYCVGNWMPRCDIVRLDATENEAFIDRESVQDILETISETEQRRLPWDLPDVTGVLAYRSAGDWDWLYVTADANPDSDRALYLRII